MKGIILTVCGAMIAITLVVKAAPAKPSGDMIYTTPETEYITPEETTVTAPETTIETEVATTKLETTSSTTLETKKYYNVNLPQYVQDVIFAECEKYDINPSIIIAMIERESQFDRYAIGDDGRSFGLMQIQPKWHIGRMIQMGYTDLFDPLQNVKVGIAVLGELYEKHNDIGVALTVYNSGNIRNGINNYALAIIDRATEITPEV